MRKKAISGCMVLIMSIFMTGCHLKHEWTEADCTEPSVCSVCGEIREEALGHSALAEADCTEPSVCSVCGEVLREALGHSALAEADCTEPSVCSVCGEVLREALGHTWQEATCLSPKTCSVCGATEGSLGEHVKGLEATYWSAAQCGVCGASMGGPLVPAFEQNGISINAFSGGTYSYRTGSEAGNATTGNASFGQSSVTSYGDGYSLVSGQITIKFTDQEARRNGSQISYGLSDYYLGGNFSSTKENLSDGVIYYFSVDYNGTVYDGCYGKIQLSYEQPRITASVAGPELWWTVKYEFYIPADYDGCVICFLDATQSSSSLKDAELLFRVK